ncbi:MAG: tRNA-intron lyase [Candidatus Nitrosocaldaceae archaeon]
MTQEIEYTIDGILINDKILINNIDAVNELTKRGYGIKDKNYYLFIYEALYLMYINKLDVKEGDKSITFDELVKIGLTYDEEIWTKFLIYRDLRSRGYVVREGFGFGSDFRVYERGEYGNTQAKYVIFGLNEGKRLEVEQLSNTIDQITKMGKEAVIAVIERRGEVIYYKLSKPRFEPLKRFELRSDTS